jgi:hypothetical protein
MRDVLFLLALPASGKSEIRRYLDHVGSGDGAALGLGSAVQLDDYPYVHLMRRIDAELAAAGSGPVFFPAPELTFFDASEWSTLTLLLDEDVRSVLEGNEPPSPDPGALFDRIDAAREAAGSGPALAGVPARYRAGLAEAVREEAAWIAAGVAAAWGERRTTLVVEFARGGPSGSGFPMPEPYGYRHSLSLFSPAVLERARALYVWVTPEESRRRNRERARPGPEGDASILHHGVPEAVITADYGCDDFAWLLETAAVPGTIDIPTAGGPVTIPAARIDNRDDVTSHLRGAPEEWDPAATRELRRRLAAALARLGTG